MIGKHVRRRRSGKSSDFPHYVAENLNEVNCVKCIEWRWEPRSANDDPPDVWLPDYKPKD
ncbi:hypothetical protein [Rhodoplanes sp. Z2-YC6860]|uniref:hypothetical protein n=1 Tax=Rhodoplanes sp. Z2-YC6860 TaxID=674703 RepID=UPI000832D8F7|nr:hypothetical protein [Rhodoplanes sp. Z2-YC6860]